MVASTLDEIIARHAKPCEVDEDNSIINYAEASRVDDWTLRSALVRLAQPHPLRSEAILRLVRRLDAALKPLVRPLQKHGVTSGRSIEGGAADIADVRLVDVVSSDDLLHSYDGQMGLSDEEKAAVGLIRFALELDQLATSVARWASAGSANPPLEQIDQTCARVLRAMNEQGVPEEQEWSGPRGDGRGARGV